MTTPGTHNDTYAGTCHRTFFSNMVAGLPLDECPDKDVHHVNAIDLLMLLPPLAIAHLESTVADRQKAITTATKVLRRTNKLKFAFLYADLLTSVLKGADMREAAKEIATGLRIDLPEFVRS